MKTKIKSGTSSPSKVGYIDLSCHSFDKTANKKPIRIKLPRFRLTFDDPCILNKSAKYEINYDKQTLQKFSFLKE